MSIIMGIGRTSPGVPDFETVRPDCAIGIGCKSMSAG
jgi:hypothetical protein